MSTAVGPDDVAVIYCRISNDAEGRELGVERQEADCRALVARLGLRLAGVYVDNDIGASTRTTKPRPRYAEMMQAVRDGKATVIVAYSNSRLSRRPREWEDVITLAEQTGVRVISVASGQHDYTTADGRATARTIAAWDAAEAERTGERVRRAFDQRADHGRPHGKVAYGWSRVDGVDVINPTEAAVLREVARRVLARESLRAIARDLTARGIPAPKGAPEWTGQHTRQLLLRERNAGRLVQRGRVVGPGAWAPLYDDDTHDRVVALLTDPTRQTPRGAPLRYLLSGIGTCGLCGGTLRANNPARGRQHVTYTCGSCHRIRRRIDMVEAVVRRHVVDRLAQPDGPNLLGGDQAALDDALARADALRARLNRAADQYADDVIDADQLARVSARLRPQIEEAERDADAARPADPALRALLHGDVAANWDAASIEVRRAVLRLLVTVTIEPAPHKGARFDPALVRVEWRAAS